MEEAPRPRPLPPGLPVLQQKWASEASGPSPRSGRVDTSFTQAPVLTSLQEGEEGASASVHKGRREPGRSAQTAGSRTDPARSSHLPGTALQPKVARQVGGQARATGPTLTWRLCSPSRQAEIKATGVSLVGLPRARTPQDPACPYLFAL